MIKAAVAPCTNGGPISTGDNSPSAELNSPAPGINAYDEWKSELIVLLRFLSACNAKIFRFQDRDSSYSTSMSLREGQNLELLDSEQGGWIWGVGFIRRPCAQKGFPSVF
jgi:hypothetical protein